ncbi:HAD family hydrolase [Oceanomicrobium pacificus]|uniref:HAD-IA family hydrolase n=1 Tax=Oceanomicrobium pacificus TaxID=2692916 RepID=A0A6B0TKC7_9RHOB|nr:HAD family phosphatase [Oceanomicrobium pacificus]MXU64917.1 HAD-IA family hydrolase [Oceanomicrobium pacificus]
MARTPEAVIFDIGNVLITWNPERLYDALLPDRDARKALFAAVDLHGMNDRIDRGAPFRDTIYATAEAHPEYRDLIRLWHDRWIEMASPTIDLSWHLLRSLRARGTPVFALSNFGVESFAYAETVYPELGEFDRRYISGHMKVIKPETRIYEMVEEDSGLSGDALFFIDDRADNIEAAASRGWQTHHFKGPEALADDMVARGLLPASAARP